MIESPSSGSKGIRAFLWLMLSGILYKVWVYKSDLRVRMVIQSWQSDIQIWYTSMSWGIKKINKTERRVWYKYIFVQRLKEVGCLFVQSSDHRTPGSHTSRISFRIEANYRFTLRKQLRLLVKV